MNFETAHAGASVTYPMQCSALRKNGHVVIKGRPCKVCALPAPAHTPDRRHVHLEDG